MSVTPEENLETWIKILALAHLAPQAAAIGMAKYVVWRTREITLRETTHAPGAYNRQQPGKPPAYGSGNLAKGMYATAASKGLRSSVLVGNKVPYSRILEFGCFVTPAYRRKMNWSDSAGRWYHDILEVKEHPFLEPTVRDAIEDGSLRDAAIDGFRPYDP